MCSLPHKLGGHFESNRGKMMAVCLVKLSSLNRTDLFGSMHTYGDVKSGPIAPGSSSLIPLAARIRDLCAARLSTPTSEAAVHPRASVSCYTPARL